MRQHSALFFAALILACDGPSDTVTPEPGLLDAQLRNLLGPYVAPIGPIAAPAPALVDLGQSLFFDKILSGNRDIACATCHDMNGSAIDGQSLAVGTGAVLAGGVRTPGPGRQFVPRNAPSILNTGLGFHYTLWDGRVSGGFNSFNAPKGMPSFPSGLTSILAAQAMLPVLNRVEMRGNAGDLDVFGAANELASSPDSVAGVWSLVMQRLLNIQAYATKFATAYPGVPQASLGFQHAANAIAAFEMNTFSRHDSPFDRYLTRDDGALTDDEKRGGILFFGKATCSSCHFGALMGGGSFFNIGVPQLGPGFGAAAPLDKGHGAEVGFAGYEFAFRVPQLRNVELTAPYMHNGAYPTLEAVLRHYTNPDSALNNYDVTQLRPELRASHHGDAATIAAQKVNLDFRLQQGIKLTADEQRLIIAFLKSLTDPSARNLSSAIPVSVPSGLGSTVAITPAAAAAATRERLELSMIVYLNGAFVDSADAKISVLDRGFIFGDGVYEVWRVVEGKLFEHARHDRRLKRGLKTLEIAYPDKDVEALAGVAARLLKDNDLVQGEGTFYVEITRGAAPRTHAYPPAGTKPTVLAMVSKFEVPHAVREAGAKCITDADVRWLRCDVKTVQLLPNVMSKQKAAANGALEAIYVRDGIVTEGTHTSLLGVKDGVLKTHPLGPLILPSVTRELVLEIAHEQKVPVAEKPFTKDEMFAFDELFVSGTTTDVTPVVEVDGRKIGSGKPGPISKQLYAGLQARLYAGASMSSRVL